MRGGYGERMDMTPEQIIREHMRELGRRGGAARAASLTPEQRSANAIKAARKRLPAKRKKKVEKSA